MLLGVFEVPIGIVAVFGIAAALGGRLLHQPKIAVIGERTFAGAIGVAFLFALIDAGALSSLFEGIDS